MLPARRGCRSPSGYAVRQTFQRVQSLRVLVEPDPIQAEFINAVQRAPH